MKIRSKHNDLMNYFIHDERDLSPAYLASCRKFFKKISLKLQASSSKRHDPRIMDRGPRPEGPSNKLDKSQA